MHDRFAQLLGIGCAALIAQRDCPRRPIVRDDAGVVDGDIGGAPLEVAHGIAALLHQFIHQLIGLDDHPLWVVDEASLQRTPSLTESGGVGWRKGKPAPSSPGWRI